MNVSNVPDYVAPIVGYRVWEWDATGLRSVNGEAWLPGRALTAKYDASLSWSRLSFQRGIRKRDPIADCETPAYGCSCGVYAASNYERLRQTIDDIEFRLHGEVYLWGKVVEHDMGYRAQFAYPKTLVLPSYINHSLEPFLLEPSDLEHLMVYGADISIAPNILLWTRGSGYTPAGSDWLMGRGKPCGKWCRQWHERALQMGDCLTILGRGIGFVERDDGSSGDTVCIRLRNDYVLIVPKQGIVWNCQNWRWEAERWDVRLSGYRDKGCPLLIPRKFTSSNGKVSNSRSSSSGISVSTETWSPKDEGVDVRLTNKQRLYEERMDKKIAAEETERLRNRRLAEEKVGKSPPCFSHTCADNDHVDCAACLQVW